jgi:tetratricopeptide (TPR) repeat protein
MHLADTYMGMGDMDKAIPLVEESAALNRKAGNISLLSWSLGHLGFCYMVLGEWDKSEQHHKEAVSISQRLDDFQSIASSCGRLGWLHFDKGEYTKAKELFEKMYEVCERHGAKNIQMWASLYIIWTCIELGEIEKVENLIDNLYKFAVDVGDKVLTAGADALRAMMFHAQKKWKEAIEYFEKSLQEFEVLNARRWNVYFFSKVVLCEYARVYLERDQEGDRERAHNLLNQALEIFQKMGAKREIERIIAKKKLLTA